MKAQRDGDTVTLTMTAAEAEQLQNELLWSNENDPTAIKAWEALRDLNGEG